MPGASTRFTFAKHKYLHDLRLIRTLRLRGPFSGAYTIAISIILPKAAGREDGVGRRAGHHAEITWLPIRLMR